MTSAADVLNVARSYLGVAENPAHSNMTIIGEKFGWNGVPWCAESVSVWQHEAGNAPFQGSASCSVLVGRYRNGTNGTWGVSPEPGDEGFLGASGGDHTFLIEANNGDGTVTTIEGNWGDKVTRVRRAITSIYGFGRPFYGIGSVTGGRPVLRVGSTGQAVKEWQTCVGAATGTALVIDGDFGPATESATKTFQTQMSLTADGVVGPDTYAAMDRVLAYVVGLPKDGSVPPFPGETRKGSKGDAVRQVQQRLKDRGWAIGVDGDFGTQTDTTVRAFQSEKHLGVDGIVGQVTWNALWSAPVT